jgi:hypothetical protein
MQKLIVARLFNRGTAVITAAADMQARGGSET